MRAGGFDAVIGNPPYIFTRNQGIEETQKQYFSEKFKHQSAQLNTFGLFLEQSHRLVKLSGLLGFIIPNNWLTIDSFAPLRKFLLTETGTLKVINIKDKVFAQASVDTSIIMLNKESPNEVNFSEMINREVRIVAKVSPLAIKSPDFIFGIEALRSENNVAILAKLAVQTTLLSSVCTVSTGLKAYDDDEPCHKAVGLDTQKSRWGRVNATP